MSGGGGGGGGAVVRQGHLRKLKTMKRKYFVLRAETADSSPRLEYYESEKKYRAGAVPRRIIPLKTCFNITRRLDLKQRLVIALYTKEEQFCVVADGEDELHAWLTDLLKLHHNEETIEELLHPTQHVWQVNVQKKGLGASKNIIGLYNLCLTDKSLSLVKIRANNNMIGEPLVTEGVEFSLKNIRRCGDSECFFYMEVGRQTATGAGELWMHTDDANIALSMHHTIYNAMCNCKNEKDLQPAMRNRSSSATEDPRTSTLPARRSTYSDGRGRAGLTALEKGLCVGNCIKQCVCATTYSIDESATAIAPLSPKNANDANPLTEHADNHRPIAHHRTVSLPAGSTLFQAEPLRIVHERTRSAPLTGDELDRATVEKAARHASCRAVNGHDHFPKKSQWCRRASTGTRLSKLSPAHTKNTPPIRNRCDSMPSRTCPPIESERTLSRLPTSAGEGDVTRDEPDSTSEWLRTSRIPEEPDYCEMNPMDVMNMIIHKMSGSACHSRTSSLAAEDPDGYLPMSASSDTVCSGTPSTDPRFSEYQLEPATAHIMEERERPARAYSVGSRPGARPDPPEPPDPRDPRLRAYSVGARTRRPLPHPAPSSSAPLLPLLPLQPRSSSSDLMEIDFTHSPKSKVIVATTPPAPSALHSRPKPPRPRLDEYVDMSPRASGYVEMRPAPSPAVQIARSPPPPAPVATTPDGYVEMNYGRRPDERAVSRPLRPRDDVTRTVFQPSLDGPASPPRADDVTEKDIFDDELHHHPLTTVREISEDGGRRSPEVGSPPRYVTLTRTVSRPIAAPPKLAEEDDELSRNPTATKTWAGDRRKSSSPAPPPVTTAADVTSLNYASLELEPRSVTSGPAPRPYTQIDFARSEKLHTADAN